MDRWVKPTACATVNWGNQRKKGNEGMILNESWETELVNEKGLG